MKRYLALLLSMIMVFALAGSVGAARPESRFPVDFNGRRIYFDVQPETKNDRTFVPFRAIFEKMGATIEYDAASRTITAVRGSTTVKLTIGSETATVNGRSVTLAAAPYIKDDRTMVPLRFVGEAFGATVNYNDATTAISIVDANWPKRGGTLNLAMWNAPDGNFNPVMVSDVYGAWLTNMMYVGMWRYDETLTPAPMIAEHWEWDSTNTKLTFYMRKDVKFFDGTPVTADDFIFTTKSMMHPKYVGPIAAGWDAIKGYAEYYAGTKGETAADFEAGIVTTKPLEGLYKLDDYTVVFELTQPQASFLTNQTGIGILDSDKYSKLPVQDWGTAKDPNNAYPNGNGPYKMGQYVEGQFAKLEANKGYYDGAPYIDTIMWKITASDVAVGAIQTGAIDWAQFGAAEYDAYKALADKGVVQLSEYPSFVYQQMYYNSQVGPTKEKAVRHAINYAINRPAIIENIMKNHASSMYAPVHPLTFAYTDEVNHFDYNPAKAKQLLEDAGWKVGKDGIREKNGEKLHLRLIYPGAGNQDRIKTAPVVQQWLKEVGIDVELVPYDWPTINRVVFEEYDFDLMFIGFSVGTDPDPTGLWDKASVKPGSYNAPRFWTEESEKLIAQGKATTDLMERMEIYAEWQKHWVDESPALIFYATATMQAVNNRVGNSRPLPTNGGEFWNIEDWYLTTK